MIVYLTMTAATLASPFGGGGRAFARPERVLPAQSRLTACQLKVTCPEGAREATLGCSQREGQVAVLLKGHLPL